MEGVFTAVGRAEIDQILAVNVEAGVNSVNERAGCSDVLWLEGHVR